MNWMAFARRPIVRDDLPLGSACGVLLAHQVRAIWLEIICRCGPDAKLHDRTRPYWQAVADLWPANDFSLGGYQGWAWLVVIGLVLLECPRPSQLATSLWRQVKAWRASKAAA